MFCNSCGSPINDGQKFCANCGAPVVQAPAAQPQVNVNNTVAPAPVKPRNKKKGNILCLISMAVILVSTAIIVPLSVTRVLDDYPVVGITVAMVYVAAIIAAYVIMVVSLVKYRSVLSKIMIVIYIVALVIFFIAAVIFVMGAVMDCGNDFVNCLHHF